MSGVAAALEAAVPVGGGGAIFMVCRSAGAHSTETAKPMHRNMPSVSIKYPARGFTLPAARRPRPTVPTMRAIQR